jgi:tRNA G26 N,N-dimethylase Trm1
MSKKHMAEKKSARDMLNAAHDAGNDQEASRGQIQSSGQYCPHCGKHSMSPPGNDLDDAQIINSVRKIKKTIGTDL